MFCQIACQKSVFRAGPTPPVSTGMLTACIGVYQVLRGELKVLIIDVKTGKNVGKMFVLLLFIP